MRYPVKESISKDEQGTTSVSGPLLDPTGSLGKGQVLSHSSFFCPQLTKGAGAKGNCVLVTRRWPCA